MCRSYRASSTSPRYRGIARIASSRGCQGYLSYISSAAPFLPSHLHFISLPPLSLQLDSYQDRDGISRNNSDDDCDDDDLDLRRGWRR